MENKGFTLLEMMVVLTVVAAIFLLTVPNISSVMNIVNDQSCDNQLKIVDTAILEYQLAYDYLPNNIEQLIEEGLLTEKQCVCKNGCEIYISQGKSYVKE